LGAARGEEDEFSGLACIEDCLLTGKESVWLQVDGCLVQLGSEFNFLFGEPADFSQTTLRLFGIDFCKMYGDNWRAYSAIAVNTDSKQQSLAQHLLQYCIEMRAKPGSWSLPQLLALTSAKCRPQCTWKVFSLANLQAREVLLIPCSFVLISVLGAVFIVLPPVTSVFLHIDHLQTPSQ
jgi:hypothetical protein